MRRAGRGTAWIAIFAILLAALAPSLARALAPPAQAMPWSEICSVAGKQSASGARSNPASGQHEGKALDHCAFCPGHGGHFALPATSPGFLFSPATRAALPGSPAAAPAPRTARISPPPRAPPVFS